MIPISAAQFRALKAARDANAQGRGIFPPGGPQRRPFNFLEANALLVRREQTGLWLTEEGRAAMSRVQGSPA